MPYLELKVQLAQTVAQVWKHPDIDPAWIEQQLGVPPQPKLGHVALGCFKASKIFGKPSNQLAQELAAAIQSPAYTVTAAGPYANFRWHPNYLYNQVGSALFSAGSDYGKDQFGQGQTILIEYCSPNIAKKLMFQHIRTTLIGNVLANIYHSLGYQVERINFVGDWGAQFAKLLAAVELWGDPAVLGSSELAKVMDHLLDLYVRFHQSAEQDLSLQQRADRCLQQLENNDPKIHALWKRVRDLSLASAQATLERLSVRFDHVEGESAYISAMPETLQTVKDKAAAHLSEGAWIVDVDGVSTPALIQKRDGTTLYLTRDLAAAVDRFNRFKFNQMLYVVSEQQRLHFQLLFGVLKKMGHDWADRCSHLSFGTVLFGTEKMSTREGRVIFLDVLLDEAKQRALVETTKKNPDLVNKGDVAEKVGIAAVIFGNLSASRTRDIEFDWDQVLALDGETGPYVQYARVRCHSLLSKAVDKGWSEPLTQVPEDYPFAEEEQNLIFALSRFRSALHMCVRENDPVHLTRYLVDLAKTLNRFYYQLPVLQATDPLQSRVRLSLVAATRQVLDNGLALLGISSPEQM